MEIHHQGHVKEKIKIKKHQNCFSRLLKSNLFQIIVIFFQCNLVQIFSVQPILKVRTDYKEEFYVKSHLART